MSIFHSVYQHVYHYLPNHYLPYYPAYPNHYQSSSLSLSIIISIILFFYHYLSIILYIILSIISICYISLSDYHFVYYLTIHPIYSYLIIYSLYHHDYHCLTLLLLEEKKLRISFITFTYYNMMILLTRQ